MDNKIIPVSDIRAYKQFGNSGAVPVVRAIAKNMIVEMNTLPVR
jgi:DNA (cytosine-5)-methyltransferase 1